jgi:hypothetical protein
MNTDTPNGWSDSEWQEYNEYLQCLSDEDLQVELSWIETLCQVKKSGKTIVANESEYLI